MDTVNVPGVKYYRSDEWRIEYRPGSVPTLVNSRGGKIITDEMVTIVLELIAGNTFVEIQGKKILSAELLEILLKVLVRVGVLREESNQGVAKNFSGGPGGRPHGVRSLLEFALLTPSSGKDMESASSGSALPFLRAKSQEPTAKLKSPLAAEGDKLISIVIVNYNGDNQLPDLLASLKRQTYTRQEIIVIDNNSRDNSCSWLKANHSNVRLVELQKNIGFAAASNLGISAASGDYILLLNNDIVLADNALYELLDAVLSYGKPWAAAAPKMKLFNNPTFINAIGNSFYPFGWGADNFFGFVDFNQFDHYTESLSACFGAVLLNPEAIAKIGLLDPRYRFYYEDMDWCMRARLLGWPVITVPKAEIYHKFGASMSLESQAFKTRYIVGNRLYFTVKNLGRRSLRRYLVNYFLEDIRSQFFYLKRFNFAMILAYMRGYLRFLVSLPALLRKRRKLQKQRIAKDDSEIFAKAAPVYENVTSGGFPKLDIETLKKYYAFLASSPSQAG